MKSDDMMAQKKKKALQKAQILHTQANTGAKNIHHWVKSVCNQLFSECW